MERKVFKSVKLCTEHEQDIVIQPTPEFDGLELFHKESGAEKYQPSLYLDRKTMESLILTLQEMMDYVGK